MRAIVTGGAGSLVRISSTFSWSAAGRFTSWTTLSRGRGKHFPAAAELHELDIRDEALEELAGRLRTAFVFHLAAQADVGTSVERRASMLT